MHATGQRDRQRGRALLKKLPEANGWFLATRFFSRRKGTMTSQRPGQAKCQYHTHTHLAGLLKLGAEMTGKEMNRVCALA
eukprot:2726650-Amphidinium_carterae.1